MRARCLRALWTASRNLRCFFGKDVLPRRVGTHGFFQGIVNTQIILPSRAVGFRRFLLLLPHQVPAHGALQNRRRGFGLERKSNRVCRRRRVCQNSRARRLRRLRSPRVIRFDRFPSLALLLAAQTERVRQLNVRLQKRRRGPRGRGQGGDGDLGIKRFGIASVGLFFVPQVQAENAKRVNKRLTAGRGLRRITPARV